jgi:hypothetical protein
MDPEITEGRFSGTGPTRPPKGLRQKLERMLAGAMAMPEGSTIPTAGGMIAKADWVRQLKVGVARFRAVDARLTALRVARVELLKVVDDLQEQHTQWKASLAVSLGRRSPVLAQFGIKPHVDRQKLTSEQRVVRAEKARQTRLLRHTGGVRQKAAMRYQGTVNVSATLAASELVRNPGAVQRPPPSLLPGPTDAVPSAVEGSHSLPRSHLPR